MNDKIHLNISKPFGPSLGKVNIPENLIIKINNYIDEVIEKNKEAAQLNDYGSSLAGQVTVSYTHLTLPTKRIV